MKKTNNDALKITFQSKKEFKCPICDTVFRKEELLSGGGRLIAGKLTDELHRLYEPSKKYGEIFPLVYQVVVCPECWFASMESDFNLLPSDKCGIVRDEFEQRSKETLLIFPGVDFHRSRTLMDGAASLYLALRCYEFYNKQVSPTLKQGIASLRCAWLLDELNKKYPQQHYDWLATLFRKKAWYLYNKALDNEQNGNETLSAVTIFGPDTDKNYEYNGMLYICALLHYKYGPAQNAEERKATLEGCRRTIAKIFGMGRSSKEKPGVLLEHSRALYDMINVQLKEMETENN